MEIFALLVVIESIILISWQFTMKKALVALVNIAHEDFYRRHGFVSSESFGKEQIHAMIRLEQQRYYKQQQSQNSIS